MQLTRISPIELLEARESIVGATFDQTVETWRPGLSSDGRGGWSSTLAFVESGPGRLATMQADQTEFYAEKVGLRKSWTVTLPVERVIAVADQLWIDGRRFEVIDRIPAQSLNLANRIAVVEIE